MVMGQWLGLLSCGPPAKHCRMGKRKLWFLLAFVLPIALLAGYFLFRPTEPSYRGRPLKEWISDYRDRSADFTRSEIDEAVQSMGTKAIPFLLKWMDFEPVQATGKVALVAGKLINR